MVSDKDLEFPILYKEEVVDGGKVEVRGEVVRAFGELKLIQWKQILAESSNLKNVDITYTTLMEILNALIDKRDCYNYFVDKIHDKKTTLTAAGQSSAYARWISHLNATEKKMDNIKIMYTKYKEMEQKKRSSCFPIFYSSRGRILVNRMEWASIHLFDLAQREDSGVVKYLIRHLYGPNTRIHKRRISPHRLSCIAHVIRRHAL